MAYNEISTSGLSLPIYNAEIDLDDPSSGIYCMSFVDDPATETSWQLFKKQPKLIKFSDNKDSDSEHLIYGVVMLADTPIYRYDNERGEYYIKYSKEVLRKMATKFLDDDYHKNIDLNHNGVYLGQDKVKLQELFIKDTERGISTPFKDIPEGSLVASYKVLDEDTWNEIKQSNLTGFSLAGYFGLAKQNFSNFYITKMSKIKNLIKTLLNFSEKEAKKGDETITIVFDGELKEGVKVADSDGNEVPDGTYVVDSQEVTIKDSTVELIKDAEDEAKTDADDSKQDEGVYTKNEEETPEETETGESDSDLEKRVEDLEARVEALEKALDSVSTPSVSEEYTKMSVKANAFSKAGNILSALKH